MEITNKSAVPCTQYFLFIHRSYMTGLVWLCRSGTAGRSLNCTSDGLAQFLDRSRAALPGHPGRVVTLQRHQSFGDRQCRFVRRIHGLRYHREWKEEFVEFFLALFPFLYARKKPLLKKFEIHKNSNHAKIQTHEIQKHGHESRLFKSPRSTFVFRHVL